MRRVRASPSSTTLPVDTSARRRCAGTAARSPSRAGAPRSSAAARRCRKSAKSSSQRAIALVGLHLGRSRGPRQVCGRALDDHRRGARARTGRRGSRSARARSSSKTNAERIQLAVASRATRSGSCRTSTCGQEVLGALRRGCASWRRRRRSRGRSSASSASTSSTSTLEAQLDAELGGPLLQDVQQALARDPAEAVPAGADRAAVAHDHVDVVPVGEARVDRRRAVTGRWPAGSRASGRESTTPQPNVSSGWLRSSTTTSCLGSRSFAEMAKYRPAGPPPTQTILTSGARGSARDS